MQHPPACAAPGVVSLPHGMKARAAALLAPLAHALLAPWLADPMTAPATLCHSMPLHAVAAGAAARCNPLLAAGLAGPATKPAPALTLPLPFAARVRAHQCGIRCLALPTLSSRLEPGWALTP